MIGIRQIGLSTTPFDGYIAGIKNLRLIRIFPKDVKVRSRKTHDTICRLELATGLLLRRFLCNISSKFKSVRRFIEPIGFCGRNHLACTRNSKAEVLMLLVHICLSISNPVASISFIIVATICPRLLVVRFELLLLDCLSLSFESFARHIMGYS